MAKHILITGGAGFIGSHLADELLAQGHRVRALDCLSPQVHGNGGGRPDYLAPEVDLRVGCIEDRETLRAALDGIDVVYHLTAKVGVGQSMYQIADYTAVNSLGTAVLMEELIERRVERLVVASSMSIYGEGLYRNSQGALVAGTERPLHQLKARQWELDDGQGGRLEPVPTPETKPPALASVYALTKFDQERICLILGRAYNIPVVALRFFNVYGPRQALSNPYTGVLAIFASQLLQGRRPTVFEDGLQQRDFVNVRDIARACRLAIETPRAAGQTFNIGGGSHRTIVEIARRMAATLGKDYLEPDITGRYRTGDIRHCFADISKARRILGYEPHVSLGDGIAELADWLEGQIVAEETPDASRELSLRGLAV